MLEIALKIIQNHPKSSKIQNHPLLTPLLQASTESTEVRGTLEPEPKIFSRPLQQHAMAPGPGGQRWTGWKHAAGGWLALIH